jgi:type IV pilus assembly protein PilN
MIRINLMPFEERGQKTRRPQSAKKSGGLGAMLLPIAIIAGVLVLIVGTIVQQQAQIHLLTSEVAKVEQESQSLAPQIAMVERLAHERADLDLRLSLIDQLSRGRFDQVRMLDELDRAVPEHMWLASLVPAGGDQFSIDGVTFSNLIIADLMIRLDRSPMFSNVTLASATHGVMDERDVVQFKLTMNVTPADMAQGDR